MKLKSGLKAGQVTGAANRIDATFNFAQNSGSGTARAGGGGGGGGS